MSDYLVFLVLQCIYLHIQLGAGTLQLAVKSLIAGSAKLKPLTKVMRSPAACKPHAWWTTQFPYINPA